MIIVDDSLRALLPPLPDAERAALEASLVEHGGARDPLVVWDSPEGLVLVDGHHRYEICRRLDLEYSVARRSFDDVASARAWIVANQAMRRNLTPDQAIAVCVAADVDVPGVYAGRRVSIDRARELRDGGHDERLRSVISGATPIATAHAAALGRAAEPRAPVSRVAQAIAIVRVMTADETEQFLTALERGDHRQP